MPTRCTKRPAFTSPTRRCSRSCARRGCCAGPADAGNTAPTWARSAVGPNLLARDFEAEDPMTKLVTDVTEFKVGGTKLYLSPPWLTSTTTRSSPTRYRSPNMKMVLEMFGGPRGQARWRRRPVAAFGHGLAVPDARLQARARADGDRPVHVPQRKLPRQREGRELLLDRQPSFTTIGRNDPISSRGIWRSISTGTTTCASRGAWTEAARSSTGSAGPLDSLLLPFRKRGPLQIWGAVQPRGWPFVYSSGEALQMKHAITDFFGATLVPRIGFQYSRRCDVQR